MKYRNIQTAYHQAAYPDLAVIAPASNLSRTQSRVDRPTHWGQLLNDKGETLLTTWNRLTTQLPSDRLKRSGQRSAISPLPHNRDRGLQISRGVYVHVLNERIEEEIEEEAGRGPSSPETNSMAGRVRVCKEGPPLSHRAEKR